MANKKKKAKRRGRPKRKPVPATRPKALPREARGGRSAEMTIGVSEGKVRVHFDRPIQTIDLDTMEAVRWAQAIFGAAKQANEKAIASKVDVLGKELET